MPIYEYECDGCGLVFEVLLSSDARTASCPNCKSGKTKRLLAAPAFHIKGDAATPRIERRVRSYLKDGKFGEATRFADKAASMVKSDRVKRIADKLHKKTGK